MNVLRGLTMLALGAGLASSVPAAAVNNMNDYDMGSDSSPSMDGDPFGFAISGVSWTGVQLTFNNVSFKTNGGTFTLTGFDIYNGGSGGASPSRTDLVGAGATLISTGPCTAPVLGSGAPSTQILTCAVPGSINLSGTPFYVFAHSGSVGLIGILDSNSGSTVDMQGVNVDVSSVPEPATISMAALGVAALALLRQKRGAATR